MFSLLRRIRRRLVGDGSFRKYLLYATGEFVLIVGGVLVALSLNNWNLEQQNREEEQVLLSQILGELRAMNRTVNRIRNEIEGKSKSLSNLEAHFSGQAQIDDPKAFLKLVVNAASFGWEQPRVQRTAFTEIVESGKLGLIRNVRLRQGLSRFYHVLQQREDRSVGRVTEFSRRVQEFIPMQGEANLLDDLEDERIAVAVRKVTDSDIGNLITAEQNRARFMISIIDYTEEESNSLLARIEELFPNLPAFQNESAFQASTRK